MDNYFLNSPEDGLNYNGLRMFTGASWEPQYGNTYGCYQWNGINIVPECQSPHSLSLWLPRSQGRSVPLLSGVCGTGLTS